MHEEVMANKKKGKEMVSLEINLILHDCQYQRAKSGKGGSAKRGVARRKKRENVGQL